MSKRSADSAGLPASSDAAATEGSTTNKAKKDEVTDFIYMPDDFQVPLLLLEEMFDKDEIIQRPPKKNADGENGKVGNFLLPIRRLLPKVPLDPTKKLEPGMPDSELQPFLPGMKDQPKTAGLSLAHLGNKPDVLKRIASGDIKYVAHCNVKFPGCISNTGLQFHKAKGKIKAGYSMNFYIDEDVNRVLGAEYTDPKTGERKLGKMVQFMCRRIAEDPMGTLQDEVLTMVPPERLMGLIANRYGKAFDSKKETLRPSLIPQRQLKDPDDPSQGYYPDAMHCKVSMSEFTQQPELTAWDKKEIERTLALIALAKKNKTTPPDVRPMYHVPKLYGSTDDKDAKKRKQLEDNIRLCRMQKPLVPMLPKWGKYTPCVKLLGPMMGGDWGISSKMYEILREEISTGEFKGTDHTKPPCTNFLSSCTAAVLTEEEEAAATREAAESAAAAAKLAGNDAATSTTATTTATDGSAGAAGTDAASTSASTESGAADTNTTS
jgi:hypothetical protein